MPGGRRWAPLEHALEFALQELSHGAGLLVCAPRLPEQGLGRRVARGSQLKELPLGALLICLGEGDPFGEIGDEGLLHLDRRGETPLLRQWFLYIDMPRSYFGQLTR